MQISNMHARIRIESQRKSRFIRLSVPIRVYTKDCRVDHDKTYSYIHYKVIFDDQTDCMSSTLPFMLYFAKTISVDFLRTSLTRQIACLEWESENTLLRVCFPHKYQHISGFNLRNDRVKLV